MDGPRVSVIIPALIRSDSDRSMLERAVASARASGAERVVVIDDGSPTALRLKGVDETIRLDQNRGPSAARNAGIEHCIGTDLILLDADDVLVTEGVHAALTLLRETRAALCSVGRTTVRADHETRRVLALGDPPCVPADTVFRKPEYFGGTGLFLSKDTINAGLRFDETLRYFEDTDLCARAASMPGGVVFSPEIALRVTIHGDEVGASNLSAPKWFASRIESFERLARLHAQAHPDAVAHLARVVLKQGIRAGADKESIHAHMRTMRAHGLSVPLKWRVRAMLA